MNTIGVFKGIYAFLSNFSHVPHRVYGYLTNEHFFQAMKTQYPAQRLEFRKPGISPGQAKRMGRKLKLRPDWETIKDDVMLKGLQAKFAPGTFLAQLLIDTGDAILVEGNVWHDNYWGDCICPKCKSVPGENKLGIMLMKVRDELNNPKEGQ